VSRFFLMALSIFGGTHFYLWLRLVRDTRLSGGWYAALSILTLLLFGLIPLTFIFGRRATSRFGALVVWPGYIWLGTLFLLFVAVVGVDLVRAVVELSAWAMGAAPPSLEEQLARARLGATVAASAAAVALGFALWSGRRLVVKRVPVELSRLPEALHGSTIVQLTDVHIGPTLGKAFLERVVAAVNALNPDVVVITGDLVDGSVARLQEAVAPLARLRARHGVFFVTGNHEYYSGAEAWCAHLTSLGLRVLRNERVAIGSDAASYDLAGIDDLAGRHFGPGQGANLERALSGRDESRELVLLAHQPRMVVEAEPAGVGLQISGHTHGGQIWPFHFLVRLQQPVTSGLVRIGRALLYVSNGTGYWGPPMRLGSPAEITQLVLQAVGGAALPAAR